jgi:phenylalanyl-tRNA synthetase beta subunit
VDPEICSQRKIRQPVLLAEVFLERLYHCGLKRPQYRELPKVPPVQRDFSLFVPVGIPYSEIVNAIGPIEHLVSLEPVETFRGAPAPEGFYGLLLRAVWRRQAESFTDKEINGYAATIVGSLEHKLRIRQRV